MHNGKDDGKGNRCIFDRGQGRKINLLPFPYGPLAENRPTKETAQTLRDELPKVTQGKEANWLATVPGKGYFAILRLYAPTEAAINKSRKPGDIEKQK